MSLTKATYSMIQGAPANVLDFGAVGDGVANDRAAIQAAFNASKCVYFPAGTYNLGDISSGNTLIDLENKGDNIAILTQGWVELVCNTTDVSETQFFRIKPDDGQTQSHFYCDPIRFRDTGYVSGFPTRGATGFRIENGNSNWGNLRFIGVYGRQVASAITVANSGNTDLTGNRIRGIFVDEVWVDDGNYGVNLAGQGDGCYFKKIVTNQVFRPLFVYNVRDVEASVFARNNKGTSGAINISWFSVVTGASGVIPPTEAIKVRYVAREANTGLNHVLINVIGPSLGTIRGIDLDLDIEDIGFGYPAVLFVAYDTSGGSPTPAVLANTMTNVVIRGRVGNASNVIDSQANFTTPQLMTLLSTNIPVAANAYNNFLFTTIRTFLPSWTGSISNPSIGNGTLAGEFFVANGMCQVTITMVAGSTTTFGSGIWSFTLPITCRSINAQQGSALALDAGTLYYTGVATVAGTTVTATFDQFGSQAQSNSPFAWGSGDSLSLTFSYPI